LGSELPRYSLLFKPLSLIVLLSLFCGCARQKNAYEEPPPPTVTVSHPIQKSVTNYMEFTGRTEEFASVDVRARVKGFLKSIHFQEGAEIEKGDLLYIIDPKPFKAALDGALAELSQAHAQLTNAESQYVRNQALYKEKVITDEKIIKIRTDRDDARAAVQAAQAKVDQASLDLGYTRITAPISGRIGETRVDVGNLVGESEPTLLATIKDLDPMYANFEVSEREVLEFRHAHPNEDPAKEMEEPRRLDLELADETGFPHHGHVDYIDLGLDPTTGTILVRGIFPNPSQPRRTLIPGFFVRIRAPLSEEPHALLVNDRAVGLDQGGRYLFVVNDQNVIEQRYVELGKKTDGMRVIRKGISLDDWVVVKGLIRARPGLKVNPEKKAANFPSSASDTSERAPIKLTGDGF